MKEIVINTQAELDALPARFDEYTKIIIRDTKIRLVIRVARENSSVVAWGNSSVEARENVVVRVFSGYVKKIVLYGCAVALIAATLDVKIEKKSEHCHIHITKELDWFERNAIEQIPVIVLFKRVSKDFQTQEETANETTWTIGTTLTIPKWDKSRECGEGKFHACSRPYFCDEFRSKQGDRYIAVSIKLEDLHEWKDNPEYPHKIAFREGTVLYECDKHGKEIGSGSVWISTGREGRRV